MSNEVLIHSKIHVIHVLSKKCILMKIMILKHAYIEETKELSGEMMYCIPKIIAEFIIRKFFFFWYRTISDGAKINTIIKHEHMEIYLERKRERGELQRIAKPDTGNCICNLRLFHHFSEKNGVHDNYSSLLQNDLLHSPIALENSARNYLFLSRNIFEILR